MLFLFRKKKKKKRVYPALYSEWLNEMKRMGVSFISEEDAAMLKGGVLEDRKYSADNYKRELGAFLEKQIEYYFQDFGKAVQTYVEENNYEYLILIIRRNHLKYSRLYFFSKFDFLNDEFKESLQTSLKKKLYEFETELISYFDKLALYTDSLSEVSTNIKRLIEV